MMLTMIKRKCSVRLQNANECYMKIVYCLCKMYKKPFPFVRKDMHDKTVANERKWLWRLVFGEAAGDDEMRKKDFSKVGMRCPKFISLTQIDFHFDGPEEWTQWEKKGFFYNRIQRSSCGLYIYIRKKNWTIFGSKYYLVCALTTLQEKRRYRIHYENNICPSHTDKLSYTIYEIGISPAVFISNAFYIYILHTIRTIFSLEPTKLNMLMARVRQRKRREYLCWHREMICVYYCYWCCALLLLCVFFSFLFSVARPKFLFRLVVCRSVAIKP